MDDLLARADYVICLAIANEETENLLGEAAFACMKPDAFFINLSRGNLIDEAALAAALDERRVAGAALDVGRAPDQMPSPRLAARTDVVATPHTGGLTTQAIEGQASTVHQVEALAKGRFRTARSISKVDATRPTQARRIGRVVSGLPPLAAVAQSRRSGGR
jgi:D-3-phosphoglycerate dehydrogenase